MDPHSDYYKLFAFDPAGTTGAEVLAGKIKKGDVPLAWSLSPNGKYLVTARSQNPYDDPALRIFNLEDGSEQVIPMPQMGLMMGMDWAADSKSIWVGGYMGRGAWGTRSGLIRVDLAGTTSVLLKGFNPEMWFAIPSPDGRQLALMGRTQSFQRLAAGKLLSAWRNIGTVLSFRIAPDTDRGIMADSSQCVFDSKTTKRTG